MEKEKCESCPFFQEAREKARARAIALLGNPKYAESPRVQADEKCKARGCEVVVRVELYRSDAMPSMYDMQNCESCVVAKDRGKR